MNEEQKNIETCLPENILSEVANVPTDPQFRSLVEESFDPLQQQALQQAGYDGYDKVAGTHQPYTFTSSVRQMKSNLILLLRRLWRFPFGRGTTASSDAGSSSAAGSASASAAAPIRSLADMWQHYITRLKGNPEYGIPSRLSSLTDLPSAPALLADRDMSSGIRFGTNPMPDGMSLAQLLWSTSADKVTEIVDTNVGWELTKPNICNILYNIFQNASMVVLNCLHIKADPFQVKNTVASGELHFAKAESIVDTSNTDKETPNLDIYMDALKTTNITNNGRPIFASRKIFFPVYERGAWRVAGSAGWANSITQYIYIGCKGKKTDTIRCWAYDIGQDQAQKLLDVEIREGACQNLTLGGLKHLTAENMYNHILCRLKQDEPMCGDGVTITLGTTNIEKLEAVEEYNTKLTELEDTYGYTFA